jgi:hypothetical protein
MLGPPVITHCRKLGPQSSSRIEFDHDHTHSKQLAPIPSLLPRGAEHQFLVHGGSCSGIPGAPHERTSLPSVLSIAISCRRPVPWRPRRKPWHVRRVLDRTVTVLTWPKSCGRSIRTSSSRGVEHGMSGCRRGRLQPPARAAAIVTVDGSHFKPTLEATRTAAVPCLAALRTLARRQCTTCTVLENTYDTAPVCPFLAAAWSSAMMRQIGRPTTYVLFFRRVLSARQNTSILRAFPLVRWGNHA